MTKPVQRRHFIKWVPKAWRADLELHSCSLAARGMWAELLMVMHDCEPYGHLAFDGRAPDVAKIARLVGTSTSEAKRLLAELEAARVFSRTPEGVIYSRRFVEDERAYLAACAHGLKGGNPALKSGEPLDGGLTPPVNDPVKRPLRARAGAHSPVRVSEFSETQEEHTACVPGARTHEAPPGRDPGTGPDVAAGPSDALSARGREQVAKHPALDVPEFHALLVRWERHLAQHPNGPKVLTGESWQGILAPLARAGLAAASRSITESLRAGVFTPFEPRHAGGTSPSSKPAPPLAETKARTDRAAYERDLERRWSDLHTVERELPTLGGGTAKRLVLDAKYPGHEAAERELAARGPLSGNPDVRKSA